MKTNKKNLKSDFPGISLRETHYKDLFRRNFIRLSFTYLTPLILLIVFAQYQYTKLLQESRDIHLRSVAEQKTNLLDLFLRERVLNIINLLEDPRFEIPPSDIQMEKYLTKLKNDSEAFTDIDFFDTLGVRVCYAGPGTIGDIRDYSNEIWYSNLKDSGKKSVITDIYLGFRKKAHFTIGVCRKIKDKLYVLRATLDPGKIYDYINSFSGSSDLNIAVINDEGKYQVVTQGNGKVLEKSPIKPSRDKKFGTLITQSDGQEISYAFSWLSQVDWVVIVSEKPSRNSISFWGFHPDVMIFSGIVFFIIAVLVVFRSRKIALIEVEKDITRSQLEQASKLASVGELASGIAHEINNPLAIIASETGLLKDMMNPEFDMKPTFEQLLPHIENIRDAVFRCRDITRKLLSFVRKNDIVLKQYDIHAIIDDIVVGFYDKKMSISNIEVIRHYGDDIPMLTTDANQIKQVLLNIINNAADSIKPPGKITITSKLNNGFVSIAISDTGKGIHEDDISKIFLPFFTTKEVGKGTGLGLSVSYGIVKGFGGTIEVESILNKGTTFIINLPLNL